MKNRTRIIALTLILSGFAQSSSAFEVVKKDNKEFDINGRAQVLGFAQKVNDPFKDDARLYLFLKQARLRLSGQYEDYKFNMEMGFAGEDSGVAAPNPGVALNLLDIYFDTPFFFESTRLRVGQFKVPYGRENLTNDGLLSFSERSIQNLALRMGRDVGAAIHTYPGKMALALGVFTGGGRDVPSRFLPENLGVPMFVARAGYNDGVDEDIFTVRQQNDVEIDRAQKAAYINGLYLKDSLVGHSTVLNVKLAEKSLLTNSNWNPFIAQAPFSKGTLWQMGGDFVLRAPWRQCTLSTETEINYGRYSNSYGSIRMLGGRTQVSLYWKPFEFSLRYAVVVPDSKLANGGTSIAGSTLIHEITPAATYYFKNHHMKIILDTPILVNVPVITETGVGTYVLTEQPDQTTLLKPNASGVITGTIGRQTVPEARLMFQASF